MHKIKSRRTGMTKNDTKRITYEETWHILIYKPEVHKCDRVMTWHYQKLQRLICYTAAAISFSLQHHTLEQRPIHNHLLDTCIIVFHKPCSDQKTSMKSIVLPVQSTRKLGLWVNTYSLFLRSHKRQLYLNPIATRWLCICGQDPKPAKIIICFISEDRPHDN